MQKEKEFPIWKYQYVDSELNHCCFLEDFLKIATQKSWSEVKLNPGMHPFSSSGSLWYPPYTARAPPLSAMFSDGSAWRVMEYSSPSYGILKFWYCDTWNVKWKCVWFYHQKTKVSSPNTGSTPHKSCFLSVSTSWISSPPYHKIFRCHQNHETSHDQ